MIRRTDKKTITGKNEVLTMAIAFASVALVIIYMVFVNVPDAILYARKGAMKWLPFILIFGALPYSIFKAISLFYPKYSFLIAVGSLLIIGPLFGVQLNRFDKLALDKDGIISSAIISKRFQFRPSNRDPEWMVQASFVVNGNSFDTFPQKEEKQVLAEGTEVEVIYSKRDPGINMIFKRYQDSL